MYIQLTNIDAQTGIICTEAPMQTGPALPNVKGFQFIFQNESSFPIATTSDGTLITAPLFYGICSDDADTSIVGVLRVLTAEEYQTLKTAEHQARKPFPSWIGNEETMVWEAPIPYPVDGASYHWDESIISWSKE